jgi:pimeloyl-ACP methyl ester carboxylesterase
VHGLAAHRVIMSALERHLRSTYASVTNWGYSSLWSRIECHGKALAKKLHELDRQGGIEQIHLVTHSMGGIIARLALAERVPKKIGKLVMLAPPNRGSRVARWLSPVLGLICPPLVQLSDHCKSFVACLPPVEGIHVGVIAAASDQLVDEPLTHLENEADHVVVPGFHSSLLFRPETARQVAHFLERGRFDKQPQAVPARPHISMEAEG